ncbi:TPA: hypothetical protein ACHIL4_001065 [Streptococcus pyogenes]
MIRPTSYESLAALIEKGQEVGRLVNKMRKTKTEIMHFLAAYQ